MKKLPLFYVLTLVVAGAAILGVIRLGSSLPPPESSASGTLAPVAAAGATDPLSHLFIQLLVIIAVSRLMGKAFRWIGQPAVVGEMAAGIVLGPSLFAVVAPGAFAFVFPDTSLGTLRLLSQVGVCLFMFAVGMELDLGHLRGRAKAAVAVSHASIVVPFLLGVSLAYPLFSRLAGPGATFATFALFMGISMSITAFPVLARILRERGISRTPLGTTAITCAAVGDVTAWTLLAFVVAIAGVTTLADAVLSLVLVIAFVALMTLGIRRALPVWLGSERMARAEPSKGTLATVLCVVVAAALTTELIGIHALFGAFLAGAVMPEVHGFRQKIDLRVESFSSVLLLPLFFAFTGLRTEIGLLADFQDWGLCFVIVIVATIGKLGASALAGRIAGMRWSDALQLGALMNTRGLMELIALNIGYDLGILSPRIFAMLVIMALATTMLTGPLLSLFGRRQSAREPAAATG